jgi:hypothetical protein
MEAGPRPEWKDIIDRGPIYKSYWTQWKPFALRDGVLERHWESADGKRKTAQIFIPHSKVKEVLAEMHGGTWVDIWGLTRSSIRSGNVTIGCT